MGFNAPLKKRWEWLLSKLEEKIKKWAGMQLTLARRCMVLNHFVIPTTLFYLS